MQSDDREGWSAHGSAEAAGNGLQEQTDLNAAAERVFGHMRLLAEQHGVIVWCFSAWFAQVRLMRMCACPQ